VEAAPKVLKVLGAERAKLVRVFFIREAVVVALLHGPKVLIGEARRNRRGERLNGGKKVPGIERKGWE
jgi:hypothetical protein